jgi:Secretion system C-terminal sorting domain/Kelch motif
MKFLSFLFAFFSLINVALAQWSTSTLSEAKSGIAAAVIGDKAIFVGGELASGFGTNKVETYNKTSNTWTTGAFSVYSGSSYLRAVSNNYAMFARGVGTPTNKLFLFNVNTDTWMDVDLPYNPSGYAFGAVGDKFFFAGGKILGANTAKVYIYDAVAGTWTSGDWLSVARNNPQTVTVGNKIFFIGGEININVSQLSNVIDVYDNSTGTWSTLTTAQARKNAGIAVIGSKIIYAGGQPTNSLITSQLSKKVDIIDAALLTSNPGPDLSTPNAEMKSVVVGGTAIFVGGSTKVAEVYKESTGTWQSTTLPASGTNISFIQGAALGKKAYFAGASSADASKVFIFNSETDMWSTHTLPNTHLEPAVASVGTKLIIAGGRTGMNNPLITNAVDIFTDLSVGTGNVFADDILSISPNPSDGQFWIEGLDLLPANATSIAVHALDGRFLFQRQGTALSSIDLSQALPGIYLLKVQSGTQSWNYKLVRK